MSTEHEATITVLEKINDSLVRLATGQEQIHTLVNSNLTAQMNDTLDATVRDLASLKEILALKEANGQTPTAGALQVIEATEGRISVLRSNLYERAEATAIGVEQAEED